MSTEPPQSVPERFRCAITRFDEENGKDPNLDDDQGGKVPRELLYARRLMDWVLRLDPAASEPLRLASRCQHIRRWEIPRNTFALDRPGYHQWRTALKKHHAAIASVILEECGYDSGTIEKVRELNLKKNFPADPDSRTLEDALCLIFLESQLAELAAKTDPEKVVNALRKSWGKMTERARKQALELPYGDLEKALLRKALG